MLKLTPFFEDYEDLQAAHAAYLGALDRLVDAEDDEATLCRNLVKLCEAKLQLVQSAFKGGQVPPHLGQEWPHVVSVFIGEAGGSKFYTFARGAQSAIVIDVDLLVRIALFIYFTGLDEDEETVSGAIAAVMLITVVVPRREAVPFSLDLLDAVAREAPRLVNDLIRVVAHFIFLHELGHIHVAKRRFEHLRVSFGLPEGVSRGDVSSTRFHSTGPLYNIDKQGATLIVHPCLASWREEMACDVFAAYADVLLGDKLPDAARLDQFAASLTAWQLVLFAVGWRQQYMRATSTSAPEEADGHPTAHIRMDVLVRHIEHVAMDFAPDWRSGAVTTLQESYESLWALDVRPLLDDAIDYCRYSFDPSHAGDGWKSFTADGERPSSPSALAKLEQYFVRPMLERAKSESLTMAMRETHRNEPDYLATYSFNSRPILVELGRRLRKVGIRFVSEDPQ